MEILYSEKAVAQLRKIAKGDRKSVQMILEKIELYAENPTGNYDVKFLKGSMSEYKRLRVGVYRVIFGDQNAVMYIYEVKHRKEAYDD
ncbi:MAG: hypothetical protein A2Y33_00795 [Spirochaetes bacterium GWF1_51_8]|nr:MAG: hypothetical protein A2Y33_00795 [Spirochaetes bacterium GWF1_51_8]